MIGDLKLKRESNVPDNKALSACAMKTRNIVFEISLRSSSDSSAHSASVK